METHTGGILRRALRLSLSVLVVTALTAQGQNWAQTGPVAPAVADTLAVDTAATATARTRPSDLTVVRRNYRYRRQVGLALFMMLFVAVALTTAQTFNPE